MNLWSLNCKMELSLFVYIFPLKFHASK
jgi:hypothetical protein